MNRVFETESLKKSIKKLSKTYPHASDDINDLITALIRTHELPQSNDVVNFGGLVRKYRIKNRDLQEGKSGGYRIIAYFMNVETDSRDIVLLTAYSKKKKQAITGDEIKDLICESVENE